MRGEKYIKLINLLSIISIFICFINNFLKCEQNLCLFIFLLTFNKEYKLQLKVINQLYSILIIFILTDICWIIYRSVYFKQFRQMLFFYYTLNYLWIVIVNTFILIIVKIFIIVWLVKYSNVESRFRSLF